MALKMGVKPETVSGNIREMVKSGHSQKRAIASALSLKRKSQRKKMSDGGMISMTKEERAKANSGELPTDYGPNDQYVDEDGRPMSQGEAMQSAYGSRSNSDPKDQKKSYAMGGMVSDDGDEGCSSDMDQGADRGLNEMNELGRFKESAISNPEEQDAERMFAKKLYESAEKEEGYAHGGLVIGDSQMENGSEPELEWENDGPSEPMSSEPMKASALEHPMESSVPMSPGLSEDAKMAIENRKKKRRFSV